MLPVLGVCGYPLGVQRDDGAPDIGLDGLLYRGLALEGKSVIELDAQVRDLPARPYRLDLHHHVTGPSSIVRSGA